MRSNWRLSSYVREPTAKDVCFVLPHDQRFIANLDLSHWFIYSPGTEEDCEWRILEDPRGDDDYCNLTPFTVWRRVPRKQSGFPRASCIGYFDAQTIAIDHCDEISIEHGREILAKDASRKLMNAQVVPASTPLTNLLEPLNRWDQWRLVVDRGMILGFVNRSSFASAAAKAWYMSAVLDLEQSMHDFLCAYFRKPAQSEKKLRADTNALLHVSLKNFKDIGAHSDAYAWSPQRFFELLPASRQTKARDIWRSKQSELKRRNVLDQTLTVGNWRNLIGSTMFWDKITMIQQSDLLKGYVLNDIQCLNDLKSVEKVRNALAHSGGFFWYQDLPERMIRIMRAASDFSAAISERLTRKDRV